jgi:pyruvate kinase
MTEVVFGGPLSERKGVNVPDVVLPLSALTAKDRRDLEFALELGVEWLALSFVQRPEDPDEERELSRGRAGIMTKLEKPRVLAQHRKIQHCARGVDISVEREPIEEPAAAWVLALASRYPHSGRR